MISNHGKYTAVKNGVPIQFIYEPNFRWHCYCRLKRAVLEVNKKFEELHGWERKEVIGKVLPMTPDDFKEEALQLYPRLANGAEYSGIETLKLRTDGSSFYASVTISPLKDDRGNVIAIIGIERDLTEKKNAEKKLLDRELQFRKLIQLNPEPIILHKDGIIEFINDCGYQAFWERLC